jgi:hypothetical protein
VKTRSLSLALCAATAIITSSALAAEGEHETRQSRFAACAHESKGLKGEDHQHFMSECLRGHPGEEAARHEPSAHPTAADAAGPHNRMKACNEEAAQKTLHGDERRAFMSACLKSSGG